MPRRGTLSAHTEISTNSVIPALREVEDALPYCLNYGLHRRGGVSPPAFLLYLYL